MNSTIAIGSMNRLARRPSFRRLTFLGWFGAMTLAATAFAPMAFCQTYRGTINGVVTDSSGAVVAGAHVQVTDETTHFVTPAVTNASGNYSAPFLMPGTYDVKVTATGFGDKIQTDVVLVSTDTKEVDFKLSPGATAASVDVTSNEELLQTETGTVSTVLTSNIIQNSPAIDGNLLMLATRVAGVYSNFTQGSEALQWYPVGGGVSGTSFGGISGQQSTTVNGIDVTPPEGNPGQYTGYVPPSLAVQELKVTTAPYDAEVGHTLGGVTSAVLKTGTRSLHGEVSFVYGDKIFNSNTYDRTGLGKPKLNNTFSQPSFVVTGPVSIPKLYHGNGKTFFMATFAHIQYSTSSTFNFIPSTPTLKERTGDFSELTAAANPTNDPTIKTGIIYDPTTTVPAGAPGTYAPWCSPSCSPGNRESFNQEYNEGPGANYIPTSRLNPVGVNLVKYFPQPTSINSTQPGTGNWAPTGGLSSPAWMWMGAFEIDHEFNDRNKLTVAYMPYIWNAGSANQEYPVIDGLSAGPGYPEATRRRFGGIIDYTNEITPSMVLDVRVGGFYNYITIARPGDHIDLSKFGFTGNTLSFTHPNFPAVSVTNAFGGKETLLNSGASAYEYSSVEDNSAILSKSFQKHALKTGVQFLATRTDPSQNGGFAFAANSSPFAFDTQFTSSSPAGNGGDGLASLLLGYPSSAAANIVPSPAYEWNYWAGFVQDDWRITRNLVLNLGVRWDYNSPMTERHNQLDLGFDFSSPNPMNQGPACSAASCSPPTTGVPQGYRGGLTFVSASNRLPFAREFGDRWQPRIGAAWHAFPNTVLRGGYAVYFAPNEPPVENYGFNAPSPMTTTTGGNVPAACTPAQGGDAYGFCNMVNPYPNGYNQPTGSSLGLATLTGNGFNIAGPNWASLKNNIWSVGIEQQIPWQMMVDVTYQGNEATGLGVTKNWNALPNCYYYGGGCPNAGNATALSAAVPNPMYGYLPSTSGLGHATIAQSNLYVPYPEFTTLYQGVTILDGTRQRLGSRLDNSLFVTVTKRASHGLEFHVAGTFSHIENRLTLLNPGDPVTSAVKMDDPQPNRFLTADVVYDTPTFNVGHALGTIVNGWKWSHSLNWQAGTSITVPGGAFPGAATPVTHHQSLSHWFNTCFIPIVPNGNVGQTLNGVVNQSPVYGAPTNCQYGEQPAWIQQPTMTLNQLNGNPMRNVRLQEAPIYNMALLKSVRIREGVAFSFSAMAQNVLNLTLLGGGPNTSLTSPAFGSNGLAGTAPDGTQIYPQANDPRIIRFETRLSF